jgi:hypothetical protein
MYCDDGTYLHVIPMQYWLMVNQARKANLETVRGLHTSMHPHKDTLRVKCGLGKEDDY